MNKIAIMTAGGDCPGLNSIIKTVVMSACKKNIKVLGIVDGYIGFVEKKYMVLNEKSVEDIENIGGTILGSSNKECPFHYPSRTKKGEYEDRVLDGIESLKNLGVEGLIVIGGDGTLDSARVIHEKGLPTVGIPKTIDNDMSASNPTIGFDTAVETAVEAIRKIRTTASSHRRVAVVEIMGRTSGYLTLHSGFASGADIILLPELEYDLDIVIKKIKNVFNSGKRYCIIAMSEAAKQKGKDEVIAKVIKDSFEQKRYGGASVILAEIIEKETGYEARNTILGHIQRGGEPSTSDIILAARLGEYALGLLLNNESGHIVGVSNYNLAKIKFPNERIPRILEVTKDDLVQTAKNMGVCFGDTL